MYKIKINCEGGAYCQTKNCPFWDDIADNTNCRLEGTVRGCKITVSIKYPKTIINRIKILEDKK